MRSLVAMSRRVVVLVFSKSDGWMLKWWRCWGMGRSFSSLGVWDGAWFEVVRCWWGVGV